MRENNDESASFGSVYFLTRFDEYDEAKKQAEALVNMYHDLWFRFHGRMEDAQNFAKTHDWKYKILTGAEAFVETIEPQGILDLPQYVPALKYPFSNYDGIITEVTVAFGQILQKLEDPTFREKVNLINNFGSN